MSKKEAYQQKLQAQLAGWRADIDKLKAKADEAGADAKIKLNRQAEDLQSKLDAAESKLDELGDASEDAWEAMKSGVENSFHEAGEGFKAAAAKFTG